jgi:putative sterol carrier protein
MEHLFEAEAWVTLSLEEQMCICRRLAEEALAVASEQQSAERAEHYRKFAAAWSDDNRKVIVYSTDKNSLGRISAIDVNVSDEFDIDSNKYFISKLKKSGTDLYEIISIENTKLSQFSEKRNEALSTDDKYIIFATIIDNKDYIVVASRQ